MNQLRPYLDVSPDADELALRVARTVAAFLRARLAARSRDVHVCLTGGRVASQVHLALAAQAGDLPWSRVHVWWGDERYVEAGSPERNDAQAVSDLLTPVGSPASMWHPFPDSGVGELGRAATSFASHVQAKAPDTFDLVMLGTGEDAHVASLFPGHDDPHHGDVVSVADSPKPPARRLSLSAERLARSDECWVIAAGSAKAPAVQAALSGAETPLTDLTARCRGRGTPIVWFLDEASAQLL